MSHPSVCLQSPISAHPLFISPPTATLGGTVGLCVYPDLSVCLSACLLATLRKNFRTDLREIFTGGFQRVSERVIKF